MKTILNKLIFGALFVFLSWKGFDGLIINIFYSSTETFEILQLEQSENTYSRNLEVINGISFKDNYIYYESNNYSPVDIVYPVISQEQAEKHNRAEPIKIRLLVRLYNQSRGCIRRGNCIPKDSTPVRGLVKVGLENLRSSDFDILESELVKIDENVILLEPNEEPTAWYWNFVMLFIGTVFAFTILKSFFRRASNFQEYWKKVTEKEEA